MFLKSILPVILGIVGDWKNYFSPMQNARLMKKYREKTIGTDIPQLWDNYM